MVRSATVGNRLAWILAVAITLAAVAYQRSVGPTRPLRGSVIVGEEEIRYRFVRSFGGVTDHRVRIDVPDTSLSAQLVYKRVPTADSWTHVPMVREDDRLVGTIPHQPPGGKVGYRIAVVPAASSNAFVATSDFSVATSESGRMDPGSGAALALLPPERPVIVRFRGSVPDAVLVPHVILMFVGMIWANRAGLEAWRRGSAMRRHSLLALALLVLGGLVFGPIVQWYAFGEAWTGFPVGIDLTDNKTLIAVLAWIGALLARRWIRAWTLSAAVVTLVIFSIPHSILGTELDYATLPDASVETVREAPAPDAPQLVE